MIDPVIFTIGNLSLRWYGVIVMAAIVVGTLIVENELKRRGENSEHIWDALIGWVPFGPKIKTPMGALQLGLPLGVLPLGIIGARLWYVFNATVGGSRLYIDSPENIYKIWEGGLHIFGGFLFGSLALLVYLRRHNLDPWLFLDAAGPAALIGQGIGRLANFINQELYGPPTDLPWGIPIEAAHRLPQYRDMSLFPESTTRFHPTFAYEMLWNFASAGLLLWLSRRYKEDIKPGTIFAGWLVLAGVGRVIIEFFRPDQPKIPGLGVSYSSIFAALMAITGALLLLARYRAIHLKFAEDWKDEYQTSSPAATGMESGEKATGEARPVERTSRPRPAPRKPATRSPKMTESIPSLGPKPKKPGKSPRASREEKL